MWAALSARPHLLLPAKIVSPFFSLFPPLQKQKGGGGESGLGLDLNSGAGVFPLPLHPTAPPPHHPHHCTDACVHPDAAREGSASSTENGKRREGGGGLAKCESGKARKRERWGRGIGGSPTLEPLFHSLLLRVTFRYAATRLGPSSYGPPSRRQCNRLWA